MGIINLGRVKPSFIIIGVQKGGTTALHNYLLQHPRLISPEEKELHFFDTIDDLDFKKYDELFPKRFFLNKMSFESTPRYIYYPNVAKNLYKYNPNLKFIAILRNPVNRAFSAWNMYYQMRKDKKQIQLFKENENRSPSEKMFSVLYLNSFPTFKQYVDFELQQSDHDLLEPSILKRGYYMDQIKEYLKFFKREQFLFVNSDNLKNDTLGVLNNISEFLKITSFNGLKLDLSPKHERRYESEIESNIYNTLLKHFQIKNQGIEELTGLDLSWMNK